MERDKLAGVASQAGFVRACVESALKGERPEEEADAVMTSVDAWRGMLSTAASEEEGGLKRQRVVERRIKDMERELGRVRNELRECGGDRRLETKNVVVVLLQLPAALEGVDVQLSYVVGNASWAAEYDVRYDAEKGEAKVTYNAVVKQTGAEAWPDVTLTISTARPTISGKPAELTPWRTRVKPVSPPPPASTGSRTRNARAPSAPCRGAFPSECASVAFDEESGGDRLCDLSQFAAAAVETAAVSQGATSMTFRLDKHQHTVGNDGKPVRVTLAVVDVKVAMTYKARPKLAEHFYAEMKATNLSTFTLMPGGASVFVGQQFISKTQLPRVAPNDTFTVGLGVANDVTVKYRRLRTHRSDEGGFVSSKTVRHTLSTRITVKNRKREAAEVVVEDQVPVSQHGDIEVTMVQPPPPQPDTEAAWRLAEGLVVFRMALEPGQEREIPIEFTVTHPRALNVDGL